MSEKITSLFDDYMARYHAGEPPEQLFDYLLERAGENGEMLAAMIQGALTEADLAPVDRGTRREIKHVLKEADAEEAEDLRGWAELENKPDFVRPNKWL